MEMRLETQSVVSKQTIDWKHIFYRLDRKVYDHGKLCFQSHFNAFKPGFLFPISVEYF